MPREKESRVQKVAEKKPTALDIWEAKVKNSNEPTVKYSPKSTFEIGQLVDHPTYGTGVVERKIDSNKVEILFEKTMKI